MSTYDRARALFERFFARTPRRQDLVVVAMPEPVDAIVVGEISRIFYVARGADGLVEENAHTFAKKSRPLLCVSYDGNQFYALRGRYRFTERGFVDH